MRTWNVVHTNGVLTHTYKECQTGWVYDADTVTNTNLKIWP